MAAKGSEWRPGPTVCRCCLTEGCYKDISTEYFWMGKREVYAEMLSDTFNVSIAYSTAGGPNSNSRLICEPCISRLRDASEFKRQVVECERMFMQHLDPGSALADLEVQPEPSVETSVKLERVKLEKTLSDDDFDNRHDFDDDDDDLDDQPLTKLASKVPKKESVDLLDLLDNTKAAEKRKSTSKLKAPSPKKAKKKETLKATSSKSKPEKKKKGPEDDTTESSNPIKITWKRKHKVAEDKMNAALMLEYSNAVVFRTQRGKFMCAYCPISYSNVSDIRSHSAMHDKLGIFQKSAVRNTFPLRVDITDLSCNICSQAINNLKELKEHLKGTHSKNINCDPDYSDGLIPFILTRKEYRCVHCELLFEGFMSLLAHMNEHYPSYVCYTCGKGFSAKHKLRSHQRCHESGQFTCSKCDLVFPNPVVRNRHTGLVHGPKDKYRCPICDSHFHSYYLRLRHLDKEHGQKAEYRCKLCPLVFGSGPLRYSHVKSVHLKKNKREREKD